MVSLLTLSKRSCLLSQFAESNISTKITDLYEVKGQKNQYFFPHQMILGEICIVFALTFTCTLLHQ